MATAIQDLPTAFTRTEADELGISKHQLYAWRDDGTLTSIGRGVFMKSDADGDPDLIELAIRAPNATLYLSSALARHGLTDEIPDVIHAAIPRGIRPAKTAAPVAWHVFDPTTFSIGRETFEVIEGRALGLYEAPRAIIDSFRLRHLYGPDLAIEALRRWIRRRSSEPRALLDLLRHFPAAEKPIRSALEVLL